MAAEHICGGFIYNSEWIVTTASCVFKYIRIRIKREYNYLTLTQSCSYLPSQLRITVAQLSLISDDPEEKVYAIYRVVLFDGYDYTSGLHDIALLQVLKSKINECDIDLLLFNS